MMSQIVNQIADKLAASLKKEIENCAAKYKWPLPRPKEDDCSVLKEIYQSVKANGNEDAVQIIAFRKKIAEIWNNNLDLAVKQNIATYVITRWGGVTKNKSETINGYVLAIDKDINELTKQTYGIASKSKLLATVYPEKFFVYDSWIAWGLNRFILQNCPALKVRFPFIKGRISKPEEKNLKLKLKPLRCLSYTDYCELIKTIGLKLGYSQECLQLIEMTLFYRSREEGKKLARK